MSEIFRMRVGKFVSVSFIILVTVIIALSSVAIAGIRKSELVKLDTRSGVTQVFV